MINWKLTTMMTLLILPLLVSNSMAQEEPVTFTIIITNSKFTPSTIEIDIGDIVIFEWHKDAFGHNVAQTKNSNSLNHKDGGFRSGEPASGPKTWEVPVQYLDTNVTLFFVCEPHAGDGMRGKIIVGEGSEEEKTPGFLFVAILAPIFLIIMLNKKRYKI